MSAFTLVSIFLTLFVSSFPAVFTTLIIDLQKSIDGARSHISSVGYIAELEDYVRAIKRDLRWIRFLMILFVLYFIFYAIIIIGYIHAAILAKKLLTYLFPAHYLTHVPHFVLEPLVALHQSLLTINVTPVDRVLLSAALVLSPVIFWRSPLRMYSRAKSVLNDARNQIEFLRNRTDGR
jgi:hypothetical protein